MYYDIYDLYIHIVHQSHIIDITKEKHLVLEITVIVWMMTSKRYRYVSIKELEVTERWMWQRILWNMHDENSFEAKNVRF